MKEHEQLTTDLAFYYVSQGNLYPIACSRAIEDMVKATAKRITGEEYRGEVDLMHEQIEIRAAKGREYREWREVAA